MKATLSVLLLGAAVATAAAEIVALPHPTEPLPPGRTVGGARYHEKQPEPWRIGRAEQVTRFNLHERGAEVRVEVSFEADPFGSPVALPPPWPREFVYDRPFFVFLWRDGAEWPYFGAWIGDPTALKAFP